MIDDGALSMAVVVRELVAVLGADAVAFIAGVDSTDDVQDWMSGGGWPANEQRLRYCLKAVKILLPEGPEVAAAWFAGENHHFNGDSPAIALRDGPLDAGMDVVLAARAFVGT